MENYYDETIERIKHFIHEKKYMNAYQLVGEELNMPYIPAEYEKKFKELLKEILSEIVPNPKNAGSILSFEEVKLGLRGDEVGIMLALDSLKKIHIQPHVHEIQDILNAKLNDYAFAMVILILVEQKIDYEFIVNKEIEIHFNPLYVQHPADSDGFIQAKEKLEEIFEKDPQSLKLSEQLLVEETLLMLPLSYEETEAELLAFSIVKKIDEMSGREEVWKSRVIEHNLNEDYLLPLKVTV